MGAIEASIRDGYRMIGTAAAYFNEREVGEGIRKSGIDHDPDIKFDTNTGDTVWHRATYRGID